MNKQCIQCKYFHLFYVKSGDFFMQTCIGHCVYNTKLSIKNSIKKAYDDNCSFWESNAEILKVRHKKIEHRLITMSKQINEIVQILKTEKERE